MDIQLKKSKRLTTVADLTETQNRIIAQLKAHPEWTFTFFDLKRLDVPRGMLLKYLKPITSNPSRWDKNQVISFLETTRNWYPASWIARNSKKSAFGKSKTKQRMLVDHFQPLNIRRLPIKNKSKIIHSELSRILYDGEQIPQKLVQHIAGCSSGYAHRLLTDMVAHDFLVKRSGHYFLK